MDIIHIINGHKACAKCINTRVYVEEYLEANIELKPKIKDEYLEAYQALFSIWFAVAEHYENRQLFNSDEQKAANKIIRQLAEREFAKTLKAYTGSFVEKIHENRDSQQTEQQR